MQTKLNKQLGLYVILLDGDYDFLKWNKALVTFGYRVDVVTLDEFELKFGTLFELDKTDNPVQDVPIHFTDGGKRPCTVYISRAFEQQLNTRFSRYMHFLECGVVKNIQKTTRLFPSGSFYR